MKQKMYQYGKSLTASLMLCSALVLPLCSIKAAFIDDIFDEYDFGDDETTIESSPRKPLKSVRSPRHRDILYCLPTNQKFNFEFAPKKTHLAVTPVLNKSSRMEFLADHINVTDLKNFLYDVTPPSEQAGLNKVLDD